MYFSIGKVQEILNVTGSQLCYTVSKKVHTYVETCVRMVHFLHHMSLVNTKLFACLRCLILTMYFTEESLPNCHY
jgi:hypothetical protein